MTGSSMIAGLTLTSVRRREKGLGQVHRRNEGGKNSRGRANGSKGGWGETNIGGADQKVDAK